jgi:hypothetical protein
MDAGTDSDKALKLADDGPEAELHFNVSAVAVVTLSGSVRVGVV